MSTLGRLIGRDPPHIPAGGRAFASLDPDGQWTVRVQMPGEEPTSSCKRLGPSFVHQVDAYAYVAWCEGGPPFVYPAGEA